MTDSIDADDVARRWLAQHSDLDDPVVTSTAVQGTTSTTARVAAGSGSYVLKLFDNPALVAAIGDIADREALGLRLAGDVLGGVAPVVVSVSSSVSGGVPPGVLMTAIDGASNPMSTELHSPLAVMARLHEGQPAQQLPDVYPPWADLDEARVPEWTTCPDHWHEVLRLVEEGPTEERDVFLHRDLQPANLIWNGTTVSGLVDWTFACRGPASLDLAHYRMNLALLHGLSMAERAHDVYQELRPDHRHDTWWDATELVAVAANPDGVVNGFAGAGITLDVPTIQHVCDAFATTISNGVS